MSDPDDRALLEACLDSSGYGAFLTPEGQEILDQDAINRLNRTRRAIKACLEDAGWEQDELVFDDQGLLVPDGSGPTLGSDEVVRYQEDSRRCADEAMQGAFTGS